MQIPTPAVTTFKQIRALDPRAMFAWGAKDILTLNEGLTLRFKTSGLVKWKGYVEITYNAGSDLYDIKFYRVRTPRKTATNPFPIPEIKVDEELEGIYNDMLVEVIDRRVG